MTEYKIKTNLGKNKVMRIGNIKPLNICAKEERIEQRKESRCLGIMKCTNT